MTIWKYTIPPKTEFEIEMPESAHVLCVQVQGDNAAIWAQFDERQKRDVRVRFCVVLTGGEFPSGSWRYVGTFQVNWFVGHLYVAAEQQV